MAKLTNQASLKGELDINFDKLKLVLEEAGYNLEDLMNITITEISKDSETPYDLLDLLNEFDGKTVAISIKEEKELDPIDK